MTTTADRTWLRRAGLAAACGLAAALALGALNHAAHVDGWGGRLLWAAVGLVAAGAAVAAAGGRREDGR